MAKMKKDKFILAVKNYDNTLQAICDGKIVMPREKEVYRQLFENVANVCGNHKGLKKFARKNKFDTVNVKHYWDNLVTESHTLVAIWFSHLDENFVETCCDNKNIKYLSKVGK